MIQDGDPIGDSTGGPGYTFDNEFSDQLRLDRPEILSNECKINILNVRTPAASVTMEGVFSIMNNPIDYSRIELYENVKAHESNPGNYIMNNSTIRFKFEAINQYGADLSSLHTWIQTLSSPQITITDSTSSIASIQNGAKAWTNDEYEFEIGEYYLASKEIEFEFFVDDGRTPDGPWTSYFSIPILQLQSEEWVVDDDSYGNSNGNGNLIVEPGESGEFLPAIKNTSSTTFYQVSGQLLTDAEIFDIWVNVEGVDGMVYNTNNYYISAEEDSLSPNTFELEPLGPFIYTNNGQRINELNFDYLLAGYLNEGQGLSFDEGGILLKWEFPFAINQGYPPVQISENKINDNVYLYPNPSVQKVFINKADAIVQIFALDGKLLM